ncbi:phage tail tip lysozyme [Kocuria palustris]|uniref:phage tail tip lysozyme n=1 Tax=Kocuria palustris TaxID=71999 RepID=UPI00364E5D04
MGSGGQSAAAAGAAGAAGGAAAGGAKAAGSSLGTKQLGVGTAKDLANGASIKETSAAAVKSATRKAGEKLDKVPGSKTASDVLTPSPDAAKLGVGGTSYAKGKEPGKDGESPNGSSAVEKNVKRAGAAGAAVAVPGIFIGLNIAALIAFLKSMFFAAAAFALNLGQMLLAFVSSYVTAGLSKLTGTLMALGKSVLNIGAALTGGLFGGAATVGTAGVATAGVTTMATAFTLVGALVGGVINTASNVRDDRVDASASQCMLGGSNSAVTASTTKVSADTEKNAKIVFSVLSEMGMPEENIAGILGNWSQESGIDATSVEGIFSEPFEIGPQKKKAQDGGFTHIPGQAHGGIGLGQWSNDRTPMLVDFAKENDADWYAIETQLAFMAAGDNPSDVAVFKDMIKDSKGSPEDAAKFFHDNWERSADDAAMMAERQADAKMWMGKMSGWDVDSESASGAQKLIDGLISLGTSGVDLINAGCSDEAGGAAGVGALKDGGVEAEEARKITELYNKEGDDVLTAEFGGGGPGKCNGSYLENCTSFSWYFITKYTTYDKSYAAGNGVDVASSVGSRIGKTPTATPKPYSVFSNGVGSSAGHTGVVLGVKGDRILIGEASYCQFPGRVRWVEASEWKAQNWEFLDMSDMLRKDAGLDNSDSGDDAASDDATSVDAAALPDLASLGLAA